MAVWKALYGWAPTNEIPLTKKVGVPLTPAACPSDISLVALASSVLLLRHELKVLPSIPKDTAAWVSVSVLYIVVSVSAG